VTGSAPPARFETNESVTSPPLIVEDDFGRFRLGIHDDATPGFESRTFAEAVALAGSGVLA
jgi:hypothetical protein